MDFKELVKTVTKEFGATSEPICNGVKGWQKETEFYINSYNKLSILSPTGQVVQLKNPIEIGDFWKYLDENRHQMGCILLSKIVKMRVLPSLLEMGRRLFLS